MDDPVTDVVIVAEPHNCPDGYTVVSLSSQHEVLVCTDTLFIYTCTVRVCHAWCLDVDFTQFSAHSCKNANCSDFPAHRVSLWA